MGVALVEVGHRRHKPSIHCFVQIHLAGVWVDHWRQFITGLEIFVVHLSHTIHGAYVLLMLRSLIFWIEPFRCVEPVFRWHISHPRMEISAVVEYHVHHNLQSFAVGFICQTTVVSVGAEAWIYAIVVRSGIAMIATALSVAGTVIFQNRCKPQCCDTQFGEIVEVLTDAFQVTTVAQTGCLTVDGLIAHGLVGIVVGVSICKTVGHQHVQYVGIGESHAAFARHFAVFQHIFHLLLLFAHLEVESHLSSLCIFQIEINQQIVG